MYLLDYITNLITKLTLNIKPIINHQIKIFVLKKKKYLRQIIVPKSSCKQLNSKIVFKLQMPIWNKLKIIFNKYEYSYDMIPRYITV